MRKDSDIKGRTVGIEEEKRYWRKDRGIGGWTELLEDRKMC